MLDNKTLMKFFDHQSAIVSQDPTLTGLWLGTGGGKTRIALALARGRTLVICPKTQKLDANWERECDKMREVKITGDYPTVISKEELRRDWETLPPFNTVIVDEAETCLGVTPNTRQRNKKTIPKASQLYEALRDYLKKHPPDRLYLCTATITRSPMTVWAAGIILGKKWDWYKWRETFYTKLPMPGREVFVSKTSPAVKDRLAEAVRSIGFVGRLEDWFDVPPQIYRNDHVELTAPQKKRLKEIKLDFPDPIVALGKRLQIENGTLAGDEFSAPERISNQKIERIIRYAEEFPRMIVWAKYTEQIKYIKDELEKKDYDVYTLTGADSDKARKDTLHGLETKDKAILIANAMISSGWEWKQCPIMIFASRTHSISDYEQARGRIQRTDHIKSNMYINLITRGGVDEAVNKSLENKKDFLERVYLGV